MAYVYQPFPKVKYHPTLGTKTVQNAAEEAALGEGWYKTPNDFPEPPKPSRVVTLLNEVAKPWWTKSQWIFAAIAVIFGIVTSFLALLRSH